MRLRGPLLRYAVAVGVDAVGTGMFLAAGAVLFVRHLGLPPSSVGLALSTAGIVTLVAAVPMARIADLIGARRALVILSSARSLAGACYLLVDSTWSLILVGSLTALAGAGAGPVRRAYLTSLVGREGRVQLSALSRSISNGGFAVGTLGAAIPLLLPGSTAFAVVILVNAGSTALLAVLFASLPRDRPDRQTSRPIRRVLTDGPFLAVAAVSGLAGMHRDVLVTGIPLWLVLHVHGSPALAGVLLFVNTVLSVVFQVAASKGSETIAGAGRSLLRGAILTGLSCLVLAITPGHNSPLAIGFLAAAVVLVTAGELFQSAGAWGLSYELAVPERQAEYLATFGLGGSLGQVAGPPLITALAISQGTAGWAAVAIIFAALALLSAPVTHWAARHRGLPSHSG
jgi:MFS family permease